MSQSNIPQLTPASLFTGQAKQDAIRLQVYNRILTAVHQKIKSHSTLPNSSQMTNYDVPDWQPGCPLYDVKDCILYIVWNLRHSGFKVLYISPNRLLISWKEQSIRYFQEESPIRQAMLAAAGTVSKPAQSVPKTEKKPSNYKPMPEGVAGLLASAPGKGSSAATITFI